MRWQRRLGAHQTALAFETVEQRGLFAAHIGAGADPHFHIEAESGARDALAEHSAAARRDDRGFHGGDRMRIFRTDIDVALGRPGGDAGDRHAFDQHERIAFHDHAVGEGAAVALVGIADNVFLRAGRLRHRAPLDAGREAGAAAAAQARLHHFLDDGVWANRKGFRQSLAAAMRAVIFERARIDDTAARERQPRLAFEPGNVVGRSEPQCVCAVSEKGGQ